MRLGCVLFKPCTGLWTRPARCVPGLRLHACVKSVLTACMQDAILLGGSHMMRTGTHGPMHLPCEPCQHRTSCAAAWTRTGPALGSAA